MALALAEIDSGRQHKCFPFPTHQLPASGSGKPTITNHHSHVQRGLIFCSVMLLLALLILANSPAILVQAEKFVLQERTEQRRWVVVQDDTERRRNAVGSWIQVLPDTRQTHDDKLIPGENFSNTAGQMAVVHYEVDVPVAGRYYVWVRAFSKGSEDNGIHVGLDGAWPASGERMQWCEGKNTWRWQSSQRTAEKHCGEPGKIYLDIVKPGKHRISFSMREDGFAMDSFLLTLDPAYQP